VSAHTSRTLTLSVELKGSGECAGCTRALSPQLSTAQNPQPSSNCCLSDHWPNRERHAVVQRGRGGAEAAGGRRDVAEMMAQQNGTQYKAMQHKYSILVESSQDAHEMLSASVKELKATVHSLENKLQKVRSLR
jgi:hypothetical protein